MNNNVYYSYCAILCVFTCYYTLKSSAAKLERRTHSTCVFDLATASSVGMPKSDLSTVSRENNTAEYEVLMHSPNSSVTQDTTRTEQASVLTVWSPKML